MQFESKVLWRHSKRACRAKCKHAGKICIGLEHTPNELLGITTTDEELAHRIAMQVVHYRKCPYFGGSFTTFPVCPRCKYNIDREYQPFCENCGQKMDWDNYAHATLFSDP